MASKYLEEFLAKASPETKAALEQNRETWARNGVSVAKDTPEATQDTPVAGRAEVKQIGQDLKAQGVELKPNAYDPQTPARVGESRPFADEPKYMNEQSQPQQSISQAQESRQGYQRDGQQNQPEKKESALNRVKAAQAAPTSPAPAQQKSQDLER